MEDKINIAALRGALEQLTGLFTLVNDMADTAGALDREDPAAPLGAGPRYEAVAAAVLGLSDAYDEIDNLRNIIINDNNKGA